jgi:hypothetical protein
MGVGDSVCLHLAVQHGYLTDFRLISSVESIDIIQQDPYIGAHALTIFLTLVTVSAGEVFATHDVDCNISPSPIWKASLKSSQW